MEVGFSELTSLVRWWAGVEQAPFFGVWAAALVAVLGVAGIITLMIVLRLVHDTSALNLLKVKRRSDAKEAPRDGNKFRGLVGQWIRALVERERQGHGAGVNELDRLVAGRYDWAGTWFGLCRSASLLVGLLFTFLGLAYTLDGLAEALNTTSADRTDIVGTLAQVRHSLPGLGTAFASSIAGVICSLAIGLLDSALCAWRTSLGAGLTAISVEWLEPQLTPARGDLAFVQVGKSVERTSTVLADVARSHKEMASTFHAGAQILHTLPGEMRACFAEAAEGFTEQQREAMAELRGVLGAAKDAGVAHLERLDRVSSTLGAAADALAQRIRTAAHDLEVSGKHVAALSAAAEQFRTALDETRDIVERSVGEQHRMIHKVEETFRLVPQMTEAITHSARTTESAAKDLAAVIAGEDMARYLNHLPELANLAESERESREVLRSTVESLRGIGDELRKLESNVGLMGSTAEHLHRSYEAMARDVAALANEQMVPVVRRLMEETVERIVESWGARYADLVEQQTKHQESQDARLAALGRTHVELVALMREMNVHMRMPGWRRLFGREQMRN